MNRLSAGVLLALAIPSAHAVRTGRRQLSVKGLITAGAAFGTVPQDTELLADANSSQLGATGMALTPTTGRNQDDGTTQPEKAVQVSALRNCATHQDPRRRRT